MSAPVPAIDSQKNYCETCSPLGFPYGEPGEACSRCGKPIVLTDDQVARGRAIRNRVQLAKVSVQSPCVTIEGRPLAELGLDRIEVTTGDGRWSPLEGLLIYPGETTERALLRTLGPNGSARFRPESPQNSRAGTVPPPSCSTVNNNRCPSAERSLSDTKGRPR